MNINEFALIVSFFTSHLASSKTMMNKQVVLRGISEAKCMHYANTRHV